MNMLWDQKKDLEGGNAGSQQSINISFLTFPGRTMSLSVSVYSKIRVRFLARQVAKKYSTISTVPAIPHHIIPSQSVVPSFSITIDYDFCSIGQVVPAS